MQAVPGHHEAPEMLASLSLSLWSLFRLKSTPVINKPPFLEKDSLLKVGFPQLIKKHWNLQDGVPFGTQPALSTSIFATCLARRGVDQASSNPDLPALAESA